MVDGKASRPVMALVGGMGDYHVQVIGGVERALQARGIPLLVGSAEAFASDVTSDLMLDLIRRRMPRGVIALADVAEFSIPDLAEALEQSGTPTVTLAKKHGQWPCVSGENVAGIRALMRHLLDERGFRRPAVIRGIVDHVDSAERERVIREECAARGILIDEDLVIEGRFQAKPSYDALYRLLQRRQDFDVVIAMNDTGAVGALAALADHGLSVPDDMALSGFDNMIVTSQIWPPLTTVDQRLDTQGSLAVELLLRLVAGEHDVEDVVLPSRLVKRTSTSGDEPTAQQLMPIVRALQSRNTLQDKALQLSVDMAHCRSADDVIGALHPCLSPVGINRCFLALDPPAPADAGADQPPGKNPGAPVEHPTTLAFSYRDGAQEPLPGEVFARHELLPAALRSELGMGSMVLQPLSIEGRERGYLLYDLPSAFLLLAETIRIELPRAVDSVLSSQELRYYASGLERMVAKRTLELEKMNTALQLSAMRDGLTGIANRAAFEQRLAEACQPPERQARYVALLMIDVDMFKAYNDRYGHLAGDTALRTVASCLERSVRTDSDLACRYGGEEFAVILPDCREEPATGVAQRFMRLLAEAAIPHEASTVASTVTASVGVAVLVVEGLTDPRDLIAAADGALYRAKQQGRHRIVVADHVPQVPRQRACPTPPEPADGDVSPEATGATGTRRP